MAREELTGVGIVADLVSLINRFTVVDLSPTFRMHMPQYALHPEVEIVPDARVYEHHGYHLQTIILPEHSGAHVDSPSHVPIDRNELTIETFSPVALWGRCITVDLSGSDWVPGDLLSLDAFTKALGPAIFPTAGDVVLFNFGWSRHLESGGLGRLYWGANSPGFTEDLCRALRDSGIRAIGTDTPTGDIAQVDGVVVTAFGHMQYFLPESILIIEGLENLALVPTVAYFAAMPLKIAGGSGSPLRPVALVPPRD